MDLAPDARAILATQVASHMRIRMVVLYASIFIAAAAIATPLVTLRSFQGYLQVWRRFLVTLLPAYGLIGLLLIYPRLSRRAFVFAASVSVLVLSVAALLGWIHVLALPLFILGLLPIAALARTRESCARS